MRRRTSSIHVPAGCRRWEFDAALWRCVWLFVLAWCAGPLAAQVRLGNEVLAAEGFKPLAGKRVGLLTNPSGVNRQLRSTLDVLRAAPGVKLVALFGPEHGVYGEVPAGQEIPDRRDPRTGLPIFSLYAPGPVRQPTPRMLQGLDALVYDLQDTGCRSYTFISSMGMAMEACGAAGVEFVILDRPNPLGGERVEGPLPEARYRSFVARWNIPYVYGLTCGELARMIQGERWTTHAARLTVVPLQGWRRTMVWRDTGLPWVPTSPHVPHGDSPMFQVATGMLGEIGGLSIGIGYTLPFQCLAGPGFDAFRLSDVLNRFALRGVRFVPIAYTPFYGAYKGQTVQGVQIHFTEPASAPLTALNFYALEGLRQAAGKDLVRDALRAGKDLQMLDKICGTDAVRKALQAGRSASNVVASWKAGEDAFRRQRQKYLLY